MPGAPLLACAGVAAPCRGGLPVASGALALWPPGLHLGPPSDLFWGVYAVAIRMCGLGSSVLQGGAADSPGLLGVSQSASGSWGALLELLSLIIKYKQTCTVSHTCTNHTMKINGRLQES